MRLRHVRIVNYRACRDVAIEFRSLHALVGANSAGKSSVLRALDFFFNPTVSKIDAETFWNKDTSLQIRVVAQFDELTDEERIQLAAYLTADGTFIAARTCMMQSSGEEDDTKPVIGQEALRAEPKQAWLREGRINAGEIKSWMKAPEQLSVNGQNFVTFLGSDTKVGTWKEKAKEFASRYLQQSDYEMTWISNPQGYSGVLKALLPHFVLVPAVRDISDEAKVTKTGPFGRLLYAVIEKISTEQRAEIEKQADGLVRKLNRAGGSERLGEIVSTESRLNVLLREYMPECALEIEFATPTLEFLLTAPRLFVDDGFRNVAENKGHGVQRAVIFSILRAYSELQTQSAGIRKRTMLFAVEEPELYMHPQAQRTIRRVLLAIATAGDQVIFSTHSALLVDVAGFDEIIRVESFRDPADGGRVSRVWQLPVEAMLEDLRARKSSISPTAEAIRELYANAYHPNRSEGFFGRRVLLVEGPTEHYALPIYAQALNVKLDENNVVVVDCGGKGNMDRLYRIFNELGIPVYLLFDYDAESTESEVVAKSKELLRLVGEPETAPGSLMVADGVACFRTKWERQLESEVPDYPLIEAEARRTLGLRAESKPLVGRYIARQLVCRSPSVVPASLKRIIEKAVAVKWRQSCLQRRVAPDTS